MSLVCGQCARVNPAEASYCYHDGAALAGRSSGPINAGSAPFANQFVFPNGQACRNFDQLALACQQNWSAAVDLLKQGYLGSFFGGMGRIDLATAAQEAAKFPDLDRGLDQLLAKLPSQAVQEPKLQAEPSEINLGQIKLNENRATELHLTNLGMRLLYGTVTSDCKWLTLGDAPGHPEKLFQFGSDAILPVQVRGQYLRAGSKPVEGHLIVDSNGGTVNVTVKADVPITPYAGGLFAGAVTPRQIAEKAKANPKAAGPAFENGEVAAWYAVNGWAYPVQGPTMSGMGSIQQFFEALGVAKAPKVEISPKSLDLQGAVGQTVEATIEVTTTEKKVVYGWATCDQPGVEVGKTKLTGKTAIIPITIRIPSPCPPTFQATLQVVGNGNQKRTVPLNVTVAGGKAGVALKPREEVYESLEILDDDAPALAIVEPSHASSPTPFAFTAATNTPAPAPTTSNESPFAVTDAPDTRPVPTPPGGQAGGLKLARLGMHLIPVGILAFCVLMLLGHDVWIFIYGAPANVSTELGDIDPRPFVKIVFDEGRTGVNYTDSMNFAVYKIDPEDKSTSVKLNWYENGFGNSTVVRIDDKDETFGQSPTIWHKDFRLGGKTVDKNGGKTRTCLLANGITVTQTVAIVATDPVEVKSGEYKRLLNTCLVKYKIENLDARKHKVGLRVLMDTCIGDKDDVPFMLPGINEPVSTKQELKDAKVPDFVQVIEKISVRDPGIVVQLGLRFSDKLEAPNRFQLTRYPVSNKNPDKKILNRWEIPLEDMGDDSSVVMYWDPIEIEPKKSRTVAFTYGLGSIAADDKLGVTVGGSPYKGGELTVVALVADRDAKTATITLPPGLKLVEGSKETQEVMPVRGRPSPVTWRVRADNEGKYDLKVALDTSVQRVRRVTITAKSLFN